MAIWQDLVGDRGFSSGYQSVRRFVSKVRGRQAPEACAVIITAPARTRPGKDNYVLGW